MIGLRRAASLSNLHSKVGGQIATLLILFMVAVLIFIIVTVNLGDLALTANRISNAADSAALFTGSLLATASVQIGDILEYNCGDRNECSLQETILDTIISIVTAVVAIVIYVAATYFSGGTLSAPLIMLLGAVGGLLGGFAGGWIGLGNWSGAIQGAITGFEIGCMIGSMASSVVSVAGATINSTGIAATDTTYTLAGQSPILEAPKVASAGSMVPAGSKIIAGSVVTLSGSSLTTMLSGALGISGKIYSQAKAMEGSAAACSTIAKALSNLDRKSSFREGIFYVALKKVVDDPEFVDDEDDLDADGDVTDKISRFEYLWYKRVLALRNTIGNDIVGQTCKFFRDMNYLKEYIYNYYAGEDSLIYKSYLFKGENFGIHNPATDGWLVKFLRSLWDYGEQTNQPQFKVSFWRPDDVISGGNPNTGSCSDCTIADPCADELSTAWLEFYAMDNFNKGIDFPEVPPCDLDVAKEFLKEYEIRLSYYYNPNGTNDLYDRWYPLMYGGQFTPNCNLKGMYRWKQEIDLLRNSYLPSCQKPGIWRYGDCTQCCDPTLPGYDDCIGQIKYQWEHWATLCVCDNPCVFRWSLLYPTNSQSIATVDKLLDGDDFERALSKIDDMIDAIGSQGVQPGAYPIRGMRKYVRDYYLAASSVPNCLGDTCNSIEWKWSDTRCPTNEGGTHTQCQKASVKIIPRNFTYPDLESGSETTGWWGTTTRYYIRRTGTSGAARIIITRTIPANKETGKGGSQGLLGRWYPWRGDLWGAANEITIKRESRVKWGDDGYGGYVNLQ